MFKKSLSLFLGVVMLLSCFGAAFTVSAAEVDARSLFTVKSEPVSDNKLTYIISVNALQNKIAGISLVIEYDNAVLEPVNCGPAVTVDSKGNETQNFEGIYAHGKSVVENNVYNIAYMNEVTCSTSTKPVEFFKLQFEVMDPTHPLTDINIYCKEYYSVEETDKNISPEDGLKLIASYLNTPTLEAPEMVGVVGDTAGLKVSWGTVPGAIGYVIYRKTVDTDWEVVGDISGADACEYVDSSEIVSGTTYIYSVAAANDYGVSLKDNIGISCEYIAKPEIVSLKNVVGGIEVSWTKTEGAKSYNIMRRIKGEAEWMLLQSRPYSSGISFKDTLDLVDGVEYEYDVNSVTSTYESAAAEVGSSIIYVVSPAVSVENTAEGIRLSWIPNSQATAYEIYRKASGQQSSLEYYTTVSANEYLDTSVEAGSTYTYSVKVIADESQSAYNPAGYTITFVPPARVTSLTLTNKGVVVEWGVVENVVGYSVYRKSVSDASWTKIASLISTVNSFEDITVAGGGDYVYAVCPIINGAESTKVASDPIYVIKAPANIKAENINEGICVTWDRVPGAVDYVIYRSVNGGALQAVATVSSLYTREYIDEDVNFGMKYAYVIKCISGSGNESLESDSDNQTIRISAIGKAYPEISMGGVRVTWDAVDGVDRYAVYRSKGDGFVSVATVDTPEYLDTRVESNTVYTYAVAAIIDGSRGILNTEDPISILYVAPSANITITNNSNNSVVSWESVEGAIGYELYKSAGEESSEPVLIGEFSQNTLKYTDTKVVPGEVYYYYIRTRSSEGYSALSSGKRNMFLAVPSVTYIGNSYEGITFNWAPVEGAEGYRVYRKLYGTSTWTYIETVGADVSTYTDTGAQNGKIMCYAVRAQNGNSMSNFIVKCYTYVKAPDIRFSNSPSGVYLTWDKNPSAVGYWIYRKTPGAKSWTRIACVTTTYYTDRNVESGGAYIYTMRAYTGKILSSFNPDGWQIIHLSTPVMKAPGLGYGAITCFWNPVAGAEGYNVYRKVDDKGTWVFIGKTSATLFRDPNVQNGSKYTYTVKAYYGDTTSSFDYSGKSTRFLTAPTLTVTNNISGVYLSWDRVSGAKGYYLYRKEPNAKYWTRIATVTKNFYTDTTAKSGKVYLYTIKAYDSVGMSGYNSYGWKTYYLSTPKLVSATSYPGGITVKWQKVTGATWYSVYRKGTTGTWVRIGTTTGNGSVSFIDTTAELGKRYTYTVRACYGSYISSFYSGVKCTSDY